jgi:HAD superfamily hydrolase (TIGR01450 family)
VRLDDAAGFVLDVDGTLVHRAGNELHVQPGAAEVLARIRASGRPFAIFTNGTYEPPEAFAAGLRSAGLDVADDELLTPLRSVRAYLDANRLDGGVQLIGTEASREYLLRVGLPLVDGEGAGAIFVATPAAVDFAELERAARAVLGGAQLLTGSYAPAYAGADGPIFSRGAMVTAALAKVTGARPVVVGKPSEAALQTISDRLGAPTDELVVIGDDLGMDVALGKLGGARTILVRSGISGTIELEDVPEEQRPDEVVGGVAELLDRL